MWRRFCLNIVANISFMPSCIFLCFPARLLQFNQYHIMHPFRPTSYACEDWACITMSTSLQETTVLENWIFLNDGITTFVKDTFSYYYVTNYTFVFTLKLSVCLVFLSAIRGGVPRYRYDFLTKMGWIKFLGLVLSVFATTLVLALLW